MNDDELQLIYQKITQPNNNEMEINDKITQSNEKMATNTCRQKLMKQPLAIKVKIIKYATC